MEEKRNIRHCQQVFFSFVLLIDQNVLMTLIYFVSYVEKRNEIMTMIVITWACHNSSSFVLDRCSLNISIIVFALLTNTFICDKKRAQERERRGLDIDGWLSEEHANRRRCRRHHLYVELDHYSFLSIRKANIDKYLTCSLILYNYRVKERKSNMPINIKQK
jgi:hypothetical protein